MNRHLSRTGDGETSQMAASMVDTTLTERHERVLAWVGWMCPATDLEMAQGLSAAGYGSEESCRRVVRTLREEHGRLVPAYDNYGVQIRHLNTTGRWAECWRPGHAPPQERCVEDNILARVARCEHVEHDCVEHVQFDGHPYYLASDLLDALTTFDPLDIPHVAPVDEVPSDTLF